VLPSPIRENATVVVAFGPVPTPSATKKPASKSATRTAVLAEYV
jgi:hypothetical protein